MSFATSRDLIPYPHTPAESSRPSKRLKRFNESSSTNPSATFGYGNLVQDEVQLRKKESIGLALSGNQKLGSSRNGRIVKVEKGKVEDEIEIEDETETWGCLVCTL